MSIRSEDGNSLRTVLESGGHNEDSGQPKALKDESDTAESGQGGRLETVEAVLVEGHPKFGRFRRE